MYKEKYLKYKTKYLDLKNQLGGNSNIIQDGGRGPIMRALFGKSSGDLQKEENARKDKERETKIKVNMTIPDRTETRALLEEGELLMQEHIRKNKAETTTHTIIFPTEIFYKMNYINNTPKEKSMGHEMKYTKDKDAFIILQKSIKHNNIIWKEMTTDVFIGLLINYIKNKIFVIQWESYNYTHSSGYQYQYQFREIEEIIKMLEYNYETYDSNIIYIEQRGLFKEYIEMLIECLTESIRFLSDHIPNNDMTEFIEKQIEKLRELSVRRWRINS
jgi:hypothetical protein